MATVRSGSAVSVVVEAREVSPAFVAMIGTNQVLN
jgi:hypothetical protein